MDPVKELFASSLEPYGTTSSLYQPQNHNSQVQQQATFSPSQLPQQTTSQPPLCLPVLSIGNPPSMQQHHSHQQQQQQSSIMQQQSFRQSQQQPSNVSHPSLFGTTASQTASYSYPLAVTMEEMKQQLSAALMASPSAGIARPNASGLGFVGGMTPSSILPSHQGPQNTSSNNPLGGISGPLFLAPHPQQHRIGSPLRGNTTSQILRPIVPTSQNTLPSATHPFNHGYPPSLHYSPKSMIQDAHRRSQTGSEQNRHPSQASAFVNEQVLTWSYPATPDSLPSKSKGNSPIHSANIQNAIPSLEHAFAVVKEKTDSSIHKSDPSVPIFKTSSSTKSPSSSNPSTMTATRVRSSSDESINHSSLTSDVDSILSIPKSDDGLFHCPASHLGCTRAFARRYNLKTHYATVHASIKNYTCSVCGWKFARRFDMKRHMEKKHSLINAAEFVDQ